MKSFNKLYFKITSFEHLFLAYKKSRKGKTKKRYVKEFEGNLHSNLKELNRKLKNLTYSPKPLKSFVLRDPKTRKISKSAFEDRIVHHAICNIIGPLFDKSFIFDSYANRKGKGALFAIKRFEKFERKVTRNFTSEGFCLKGDIKHYFEKVNREILINILKKKIKCEKTILLIRKILNNFGGDSGMPLGNLTSQFFANVYLGEFDKFVKHKLKAKYYIRYVDDFVILHNSEKQLKIWKENIEKFLINKLNLTLHPDKSKIINLSKGIDFLGFRHFYRYKLLRKRNRKSIIHKIKKLKNNLNIMEIFQGWNSYAKWGNTFYLRKNNLKKINKMAKRN
jgi:RNA-directed DNA polymerase